MIDTRRLERRLRDTKDDCLVALAGRIKKQNDRQTDHDGMAFMAFFGSIFFGWLPGIIAGNFGAGWFFAAWAGTIMVTLFYVGYACRQTNKLWTLIDEGISHVGRSNVAHGV